MKILFLNNFYYLRGGSERVLFGEMRILREAGHEVAIYVRGHEKNEPAEYAEFFPPPLDTERLSLSLTTVRTVKELIYSDAARRGLREVIARFRPDIVHAHNIYGRLSLSVLDEIKVAGVPVVMTLHDLKLLCPSYLMFDKGKVCERCRGKRYYHAVLTRCHKGSYVASFVYALESWINHTFGKYASVSLFIAPSRFLRDKCIAYGMNSERMSYIPNFIDDLPMPQSGAGDYLLYMGRLSHEKGVATLIRACSRLSGLVALKVVGEGPGREMLEREALAAGLQISFTGYLNGPALEDALNRARGIVLPSECYENAPLSLLEAFAHHKPVIGARIGGIPEMIDDGVNGFLFEPGNVTDLQQKLELFLNLPVQTVLEMGKAAREKVKNEYNAESHYEKLMHVYRSVPEKTCE
jgi:glycosyltransferase involved in cell wall biosynthesis